MAIQDAQSLRACIAAFIAEVALLPDMLLLKALRPCRAAGAGWKHGDDLQRLAEVAAGRLSQLVPPARKMLHELVQQWQPHLRCVQCARLHAAQTMPH